MADYSLLSACREVRLDAASKINNLLLFIHHEALLRIADLGTENEPASMGF